MSDLLEQAVIEYWGERCPDFDPGCPGCLAWKMVDELASLRSENESLRQKTQYWPDNAERDAVIRHQKEEIERLRAALEDILSYVPHGDLPVTIYDNALAALNIVDLDSVLAPPKKDSWE